MTVPLSRRRLLGAALATGAALPLGAATRAAAATAPPRLTLPRPTGPYPVGTTELHLVDGHRELMASVWYPARDTLRHPRAPWLDEAPLRLLMQAEGFDPDAARGPVTSGHVGAPVRRTRERLPVVVYSHNAHGHRSQTTVIVQELASHGYAAVTVDHTGDAFSRFPDGRVITPDEDTPMAPGDFAHDVGFVVDTLERLARGHNPDAGRRTLPDGLGAALDLGRLGVFGHSKGATATALLMAEDRRVQAGLVMDGPMESVPPPLTDLRRPVMVMSGLFTRADPPVARFWSHLRGWRLDIQADGALHQAYNDYQTLVAQLAPLIGLSDEDLRHLIGPLDPRRAVRIQQAYPLAFFDRHLRHRASRLLNGPSAAFPEVRFVP